MDKLPFISEVLNNNKITFSSFLKKANVGKVKNLAHLYMINCLSNILEYEKECSFLIKYITEQNYNQFLNIVKQIFDIPFVDQNMNDQKSDKKIHDKSTYKKISSFFYQYFSKKIDFFEFKSNIEIVTYTSLDNPSNNYSMHVNSFNSLPFANFVQNAFFGYKKHTFSFEKFCESVHCYQSQNNYIPSFNYTQYEKRTFPHI